MSEFNAALVMIGLFALRCVVPIALTFGLGYVMNRLVDRWEAEDARKTIPVPVARPIAPVVQAEPARSILSLPCWVTNSCAEKKLVNCAAYRAPHLPCWEARRQAEGALPARCPDCPRYQAQAEPPFAIAM
jgi:hypothetical protein